MKTIILGKNTNSANNRVTVIDQQIIRPAQLPAKGRLLRRALKRGARNYEDLASTQSSTENNISNISELLRDLEDIPLNDDENESAAIAIEDILHDILPLGEVIEEAPEVNQVGKEVVVTPPEAAGNQLLDEEDVVNPPEALAVQLSEEDVVTPPLSPVIGGKSRKRRTFRESHCKRPALSLSSSPQPSTSAQSVLSPPSQVFSQPNDRNIFKEFENMVTEIMENVRVYEERVTTSDRDQRQITEHLRVAEQRREENKATLEKLEREMEALKEKISTQKHLCHQDTEIVDDLWRQNARIVQFDQENNKKLKKYRRKMNLLKTVLNRSE